MTQSAKHRQFEAFVKDHGAVVLAFLRRLCGNSDDAEELFQETAMRVWRHAHQWPRLRNPRAWLMTIAYRVYLNHAARRRPCEALTEQEDQQSLSPDVVAVKLETAALTQAAVDRLADPLREVVLLHYIGQLTLRQTAAAMGLSTGTVKSRLHAALVKLRSELG